MYVSGCVCGGGGGGGERGWERRMKEKFGIVSGGTNAADELM